MDGWGKVGRAHPTPLHYFESHRLPGFAPVVPSRSMVPEIRPVTNRTGDMQEIVTRSDEQAQLTPSLFQWVWRSYFRTALIPLVLVEVLFIAIYLAANHLATQENLSAVRTIAGDELRRITQREVVTIQKQLLAVSQFTDLFRR